MRMLKLPCPQFDRLGRSRARDPGAAGSALSPVGAALIDLQSPGGTIGAPGRLRNGMV